MKTAYWTTAGKLCKGTIIAEHANQLVIRHENILKLVNTANSWEKVFDTPDEAVNNAIHELMKSIEQDQKSVTALLRELSDLKAAWPEKKA